MINNDWWWTENGHRQNARQRLALSFCTKKKKIYTRHDMTWHDTRRVTNGGGWTFEAP